MIVKRRHLLLGVAATSVLGPRASAAPPDARRLENRTELWANYARRTQNILARLISTRETSLLDEPLVSTGQFVFEAPNTLVLRDDGLTGSSTYIHGNRVSVLDNQAAAGSGKFIDTEEFVAAGWLADRLIRMFAPADPAGLTEGARINVPRGQGYRVELMPPQGSAVRAGLRSVTVHLDPVAGAVTQIVIAEAQGDRLSLALSDHRQNVDEADVTAVIDPVRALLGE